MLFKQKKNPCNILKKLNPVKCKIRWSADLSYDLYGKRKRGPKTTSDATWEEYIMCVMKWLLVTSIKKIACCCQA